MQYRSCIMNWGALLIVVLCLFPNTTFTCETEVVDDFALHGKSVKFEESELLRLPPDSHRYGLWLAAEYEGVRAVAISPYVVVSHSNLSRRLLKFFGGYYKFPNSWWPEVTYLGGGEFLAINEKKTTALATLRHIHDGCGFLKGPRSEHKKKDNPAEALLWVTPQWLSGGATIKRVVEGFAHLHPRLPADSTVRHDLLKPSYTINLIVRMYLWEQALKTAEEIQHDIFEEKLKGMDMVELGLLHTELVRGDGLPLLAPGAEPQKNVLYESELVRWETLLKQMKTKQLSLTEIDELGKLAGLVHDAASHFDTRASSGLGIEVLVAN